MEIFDIHKLKTIINWNAYDAIAFIGRGKDAGKYIYQSNVFVMCINDSIEFYPSANFTAVVEVHLSKQIPLIMKFNEKANVILIRKKHFDTIDLVVGCTPSMIISYCLKNIPVKKVYLQGFSMDGIITNMDLTLFEKQKNIFRECCELAMKEGIDKASERYIILLGHTIGLVTYFPYDWNKQVSAFTKCFKIAKEMDIDMGFVTYCSKLNEMKRMEPDKKDILIVK